MTNRTLYQNKKKFNMAIIEMPNTHISSEAGRFYDYLILAAEYICTLMF